MLPQNYTVVVVAIAIVVVILESFEVTMRLFIFCMRMKGFGAYMNVVLQPNKTKTKARIPLAVSKNDLAELLLLRFQRQHWSVCVLALK